VVTQTQLERLFPALPVRTVRYRVARLYGLGLVGRSRPYREHGSAPFHLWPTRQADAFVRGEPVPRRGERSVPNPAFLAHAAGLTELYVLFVTEGAGLALRGFRREGEAREPFRSLGRERALAPDVLLDLEDERGMQLLAFVELDLGTMSRPRLKAKAAGYASYAAGAAWEGQRHPFCPCLLFLTTTEARALAFLKALADEIARAGRGGENWAGWLTAGACAMAYKPERALSEACWDDFQLGGGGLTLVELLRAARAPFDEARAREEAKRQAREQRLTRLRTDMQALREHLQARQGADLYQRLSRFGEHGREALYLLLESEAPLSEIERDALEAVGDWLGDDVLGFRLPRDELPPVDPRQQSRIDRLVAHYRRRQLARVDELIGLHGELPHLRAARRELTAGGLLSRLHGDLQHQIRNDLDTAIEQDLRQRRYLDYREREVRARAGVAARLLRRAELEAATDRRLLRMCDRCGEIAYPDPNEQRHLPASSCLYCRYSGSLRALDETPRIEAGG
jgi:hypothetical protein